MATRSSCQGGDSRVKAKRRSSPGNPTPSATPSSLAGHGLDQRLRQHFADVFQGFGITEKHLPGGIG